MSYFTRIEIKNCRRFIKYFYTTLYPIDRNFIEQLSIFGTVQVNEMSCYSSKFKDFFKIYFEDDFEISGTINDFQLYFTVSKESPSILFALEDTIINWSKGKHIAQCGLSYTWLMKE